MTIKLYEITKEFDLLEEMLQESQGELTEDHEELLDHVEYLLSDKVDGCVEYRTYLKDKATMAKERADKFLTLKKQIDNKLESYDNYMISCLERIDKNEVNGDLHKIKIRKPSRQVKIIDENKIPLQYLKSDTTTKIIKADIAKALKAGELVDGATLIDGKKSLLVR